MLKTLDNIINNILGIEQKIYESTTENGSTTTIEWIDKKTGSVIKSSTLVVEWRKG